MFCSRIKYLYRHCCSIYKIVLFSLHQIYFLQVVRVKYATFCVLPWPKESNLTYSLFTKTEKSRLSLVPQFLVKKSPIMISIMAWKKRKFDIFILLITAVLEILPIVLNMIVLIVYLFYSFTHMDRRWSTKELYS